MFAKILIANRGEIACRIMATARRLGIATVAVNSDADAVARHVSMADEAFAIGPAPARDSYLVGARIIEAALRSGAEAVHPGYGFLSENAEFAEACAAAGLVFIGPPPPAIRAMGSKSAAKSLMERSGVPLVPGYHGAAQDVPTLARAAETIGWPILIKASAGGGGKGMRVVESAAQFETALAAAKREAMASFSDDAMLIEKYLTRPRHIEVQVFADTHGNCVSLFERDCSIQRRHQKIVEEAPAPGLDPARRRSMSEAAVAAARAIDYVGAGTVEFIVEDDRFYFMEMNTRLQVEHPVTEKITGQDLVEWQLRVASGEPLPLAQDDLRIHGHAIEMRVYAEDPARDFLPSIGTLAHLRQPDESASVRVDTGVREGDSITPFYDPMIAKLIVHGTDRAEALARLRVALAHYEIVGVETNLGLLRAIAAHPAFAAADLDTSFLTRHALMAPAPELATETQRAAIVAAALAHLADLQGASAHASPADPHSPWAVAECFRLNGSGYQDVTLHGDGGPRRLRLSPRADGACAIAAEGWSASARLEESPDGAILWLDGARLRLRVIRHATDLVVIREGRNQAFRAIDPLAPPEGVRADDNGLSAPIPARVTHVLAVAGQSVKKGAPLMVLEAMKMELTLSAPLDGTIESVRAEVGDMVEEGAELVTFARAGASL